MPRARDEIDRIVDKLHLVAAGEDDDAMMIACTAFAGLYLDRIQPMDERRAAWSVMCKILSASGRVKFPKAKKAQLISIKGGKASHAKPG